MIEVKLSLTSNPSPSVKLALAQRYPQYKLTFTGTYVRLTHKPYMLHPQFLLDFSAHTAMFVEAEPPYSDVQALTLLMLALLLKEVGPVRRLLSVDKQRLLSTAFGLASLKVADLFSTVLDWPALRVADAFEEAAKAGYVTDTYPLDPPYEDQPTDSEA